MSTPKELSLDPRFSGSHSPVIQKVDAELVNPEQEFGYDIYITPHAEQTMLHLVTSTFKRSRVQMAIESLAALPRALDSYQRKNGVDVFMQFIGETKEYQIEYAIHSGAVTIYSFSLAGESLRKQQKRETPRLYHIKKNRDCWSINTRKPPVTSSITTKHAAVNGQSNDLQKAAWLMGDHLEKRYGNIYEYTLYHNPTHYLLGGYGDTWESTRDKIGLTTPVAKKFSRVLSEAQKSESDIKWVAHSQGAAIFAEAARIYEKNERKKGVISPSLDKHSVAFNSGAINIAYNRSRLTRMGVRFTVHNAPDDLVPQIAGLNSVSLLFKGRRGRALGLEKIKRSFRSRKGIFNGTTTESSHTLAYCGSYDRKLKLLHGLQTPDSSTQAIHDASLPKSNGFRFFNFGGVRRR